MAAQLLKQKAVAGYGLDGLKGRISNPPYRESLPGSFPFLEKASQTDLSLIIDAEKTLATLASLKEEMLTLREELRLTKKYLHSEYEVLLQRKSMELLRRINDGLEFITVRHRKAVSDLQHAFRQQVADVLAKEGVHAKNPEVTEEELAEESAIQNMDIIQLKLLAAELKNKIKYRNELITQMQMKLSQYTQQQEQLQVIQKQQQKHVLYLQEKQRNRTRSILSHFISLTPLGSDESIPASGPQLGDKHKMKVKHEAEMKTLIAETDRLRGTVTLLNRNVEMRDLQIRTLQMEVNRMKEQQKIDEEHLDTLQQQLKDSRAALETEKMEAARVMNEIKTKLAQEAERQERRRKWQQFMQDPSKLQKEKKLSVEMIRTPEALKEEVMRIAIESEFTMEVWQQILTIMKKELGTEDVVA